MKLNTLVLLFVVLLTACTQVNEPLAGAECSSDSDCSPAGCSSQLCIPKEKANDIITTCEFRPEYECLRLTNCGCISNKCQWIENDDYSECLEDLK